MKIQITVENLVERKNKILQNIEEIRDTYLMNEFSYKGVLPVVAVIDGRSIPTWVQVDFERDFKIEMPTSPAESMICEFFQYERRANLDLPRH